jgi:hypothetical protein
MRPQYVIIPSVFLAGLAFLFGQRTVAEEKTVFNAGLAGTNEVPPVDTQAIGEAFIRVVDNGKALHYKLIVTNIENVTMAHIHLGKPGHNGPPLAWLYPSSPPPVLIPGTFSDTLAAGILRADNLIGPLEGKTIAALVEAIRAGQAYVNVHTKQHPEGEIRGPID